MTLRVLLAAFGIGTVALAVGVAASPLAEAGPPYKNCTEAHEDGRYDIPEGDSAYRPPLDRDLDGIACESF
ncbi:MAG: excalibur calcium-binding domain-containing protein [Mycobacterium sp.]